MNAPCQWMSFEAWKEEGMRVRKGQKSELRSPQGIPLFNEDQVEEEDPWERLAPEDLYGD